MTLDITVQYANTREQFKQPIANFGAIQHKLAEMAIQIWVAESALYRTAKWIDEKEKELLAKASHSMKPFGAAEEYAIECAMLKVYGSELLDYVLMKVCRCMEVMDSVRNIIFQGLTATAVSTGSMKAPMRSTGC